MNTPSSRNRQQAADLIARIAVVMKQCDEEQMLSHLGLYLYEYLGEEYPEVSMIIVVKIEFAISREMTDQTCSIGPRQHSWCIEGDRECRRYAEDVSTY